MPDVKSFFGETRIVSFAPLLILLLKLKSWKKREKI
jgi:hypothetical protein